jgi:hypothetical protein
MVASDFDQFVEQYHRALDEFFRGDPNPAKALYSHLEDATLANPFGPVAIGWELVAEAMERAASNYRDGEATTFETLSTHRRPNWPTWWSSSGSGPRSAGARSMRPGRCV